MWWKLGIILDTDDNAQISTSMSRELLLLNFPVVLHKIKQPILYILLLSHVINRPMHLTYYRLRLSPWLSFTLT